MPTVASKEVGPYGYGLMGLTWRANPVSDDQAFAAMRAALANGSNFWNGGEFYGTPDKNSLTLLNRYFTKYPEDADKVVLSIKGGLENMVPKGDKEHVRASVENCVKLLGGKKKIDMFECARVDHNVAIEDTINTLGELVKEGKIGSIALSEVNAQTIRRAAKVHTIAAVEVEVSLFEMNAINNGVLTTCGELGIPLVAYSPIGRGFLTGQVRKRSDLPEGDLRLHFPRFSEENFPKNLQLVERLEQIAKEKGVTPAQLALAWVSQLSKRSNYPTVIPIPGATTAERVNENFSIKPLSSKELEEIEKVIASLPVFGDRYPEVAKGHLDG